MIQSLVIENFMSIEQAKLDFDSTNIIDLCGYNDSGKSAIIRLLDIMFYDSYKTEQVKFIQDGKNYFRGILYFADGIVYERIKHVTGQSEYNVYNGTELVYTNRKGDYIVNVDGVPDVISRYLGVLCDENTGEKLNVRRCTDRLFLIETTGGDNYKSLNYVLQSDVLASASMHLVQDRNRLQSDLMVGYSQLATLKNEQRRITVSSDTSLNLFENNIEIFKQCKQRFDSVRSISNLVAEISNISIPIEAHMVDLGRYNEMTVLSSLKSIYDRGIAPEVSVLSTDRLDYLTEAHGLKVLIDKPVQVELGVCDAQRLSDISSILSMHSKATMPVTDACIDVDVSQLNDIIALHDLLSIAQQDIELIEPIADIEIDSLGVLDALLTYKSKCSELSKISSEHDAVSTELSNLSKEHGFIQCPSCGNLIFEGGNCCG